MTGVLKPLLLLTAAVCVGGYSFSASSSISASAATSGVSCENGEDYLPDPNDCGKFWRCANKKPYQFTCPAGLHFNTHLSVCDWPENVNCFSSGGAGTGGTYSGSSSYYYYDDSSNNNYNDYEYRGDHSYDDSLYPYQPGPYEQEEEQKYYTERPRVQPTNAPVYRPVNPSPQQTKPVYRPSGDSGSSGGQYGGSGGQHGSSGGQQYGGSGGQYQGSGGQYQGSGGQYQGSGGQYQGSGGKYQGSGGQYQGSGGKYQGSGGQYQGSGGQYQGSGGQYQGSGGQYQGSGGQYQGSGGHGSGGSGGQYGGSGGQHGNSGGQQYGGSGGQYQGSGGQNYGGSGGQQYGGSGGQNHGGSGGFGTGGVGNYNKGGYLGGGGYTGGQTYYQQQQPYYPQGNVQPSFGTNQFPSVGQQFPVYGQQQPHFGQQQPFYGQQQPFYGQQQPFFGQQQPVFGQGVPSVGIKPKFGPPVFPSSGFNLGKPKVGISSLGKAFFPVIQKNPQLSSMYQQWNPLGFQQPNTLNDFGWGATGHTGTGWGTGIGSSWGHTGTGWGSNKGGWGTGMNLGTTGHVGTGWGAGTMTGHMQPMWFGQHQDPFSNNMMSAGSDLEHVLLPVKLVMTTSATTNATTTTTTTTTAPPTGSGSVNVIVVAPFLPPGIPLPLPPLIINGTLVDPLTLQPVLPAFPGLNLTTGLPLPSAGLVPALPGGILPADPCLFPQLCQGQTRTLQQRTGVQTSPGDQNSFSQPLRTYGSGSTYPYSAVAATLSQSGGLALNPFSLNSGSTSNVNNRNRCTARQGLGTVTIPLTRRSGGSTFTDTQCNALGQLVRNYVLVFVENQSVQQSSEPCEVEVPNIRVQCSNSRDNAFAG